MVVYKLCKFFVLNCDLCLMQILLFINFRLEISLRYVFFHICMYVYICIYTYTLIVLEVDTNICIIYILFIFICFSNDILNVKLVCMIKIMISLAILV